MSETTNDELERMTPAELDAWSAAHDEGPDTDALISPRGRRRRMDSVTIRVPPELLGAVKAEAAARGQHYQRYLRALLQLGLAMVQEGRAEAAPPVVSLTPEQARELSERGSLTLRVERRAS